MTSLIIFTDLDRKQQHKKVDIDMHSEQPTADQSYSSPMIHELYSRILMQNVCKTGNLSVCKCMLTHISL